MAVWRNTSNLMTMEERNTWHKKIYLWQLLNNKKNYFFIWMLNGVYSVALDNDLSNGKISGEIQELQDMQKQKPKEITMANWWLLLSSVAYLVNTRKHQTIGDIKKFCKEYLKDYFSSIEKYIDSALWVLAEYKLLKGSDDLCANHWA